MSYTLPSDEAIMEIAATGAPWCEWGEHAASLKILRAVARLAIEHFIAEAVKASGVDVEALAESCCDCEGVVHYDGCWVPLHFERVAAAIRTAIAQAVARERERIAAWLDAHPDSRADGAWFAAWIREGADR